MATKKEHFEETLANVKRGHRLHEWESAAVSLAWMSELYVDELQNEVERLRTRWSGHVRVATAEKYRARAEAAEAESARLASVVAKVEALRDRWLAVNVPSAEVTSWSHYAGDALRAALTSVGVSGSADDRREANASQAPDTAAPGERRMTYVDAKTHEPCPTSGPVLCTIGYTVPAHRHVAAHMRTRYTSAGTGDGTEANDEHPSSSS